MKLVLYGDEFNLGILDGDSVIDASSVADAIGHHSPQELMSGLIADFDRHRGALEQLAASGSRVPADSVRLRAPLPRPPRLVCMAVNYLEHDDQVEPAPINAFNKSSGSVIGDGDTIVLPSAPATVFEHEAELGLVIGKRASAIKAEDAYDYVFGYVNFIDVSCRGIGPAGRDSFFIGKSWDTFGPMGPAIVTADEVADPLNLPVRLSVQGVLRQDYSTRSMGHKIPELLEWVTWITALEPGDVVACGTHHQGLGPLQDGDVVEMEIAEFGKLTLNVTDELKRSWPRETRAQREAREAAGR
ncbi:MAG: fumarylacetoacetate hydrolase family protein [Chloroflexota bacterium]|nr:fumarylacetoacetate hydrolase family protein [Chloroflexota bacterium]MDE2942465.1 fumarylacetoacetate hydrolase family protein [Chloroflexota bacterium]MDE3267855.1 fumarylacetoacetate hydrolase family protein [Chloroflexota bacterium]